MPCFLSTAAAEPAGDDFYAGETGQSRHRRHDGRDYGAYAQLIAQHIGRFVPGKPTVIVQTMLGGAGLVALNHLAKIAAQDGTVLSLPHANIVQDGLFNPRAQFDPAPIPVDRSHDEHHASGGGVQPVESPLACSRTLGDAN